MAALKGNEYYKLRSKDGRDKIFETPEDLKNACNEYFLWCIENPLYETVVVKLKISRDEEEIRLVKVPKIRAFTLKGLCNYIDISIRGFNLYEERKDFMPVTTRVQQNIENQKFEGAASGFFNSNIIARDLGLVDKKEQKVIQEQPLFPEEE